MQHLTTSHQRDLKSANDMRKTIKRVVRGYATTANIAILALGHEVAQLNEVFDHKTNLQSVFAVEAMGLVKAQYSVLCRCEANLQTAAKSLGMATGSLGEGGVPAEATRIYEAKAKDLEGTIHRVAAGIKNTLRQYGYLVHLQGWAALP